VPCKTGRKSFPHLIYNLDEAGVDQVSEMDGERHVVVLKMRRTPTYRKTSAAAPTSLLQFVLLVMAGEQTQCLL